MYAAVTVRCGVLLDFLILKCISDLFSHHVPKWCETAQYHHIGVVPGTSLSVLHQVHHCN